MYLPNSPEGGQQENKEMLGQIRIDNDIKAKQKELVLGGLPVIFPYDPYPSQTDYMTSVIRSLDNR